MGRQLFHRLSLATVLALLWAGCGPAAGQDGNASPSYRIRPSAIVLPKGVKPGDYARTTRPFENWTLICDQNFATREKICNVTQIIEDSTGRMVFSWSLAATQAGKPYMILRAAANAMSYLPISVQFTEPKRQLDIHIDGCNEDVCLGMLPVERIMREQIAKNAETTISYMTRNGDTVTIQAPLKGLSVALSAIK